MTTTGKSARKRYGNRFACKRAKAKRERSKAFGQLPYSTARKTAEGFVRDYQPACTCSRNGCRGAGACR